MLNFLKSENFWNPPILVPEWMLYLCEISLGEHLDSASLRKQGASGDLQKITNLRDSLVHFAVGEIHTACVIIIGYWQFTPFMRWNRMNTYYFNSQLVWWLEFGFGNFYLWGLLNPRLGAQLMPQSLHFCREEQKLTAKNGNEITLRLWGRNPHF